MISILKKKLFRLIKKKSSKEIEYFNRHKNYDDYINKQKEKTNNPKKIKIWKEDQWEEKVKGFENLFNRNKAYVNNKKKAICFGARTGQEVFVLKNLGLDAIGVDLVSFPPYTIQGDIHNVPFGKGEFDLVFTNIIDHSLNVEKFISEMERVCKKKGNIIINILINHDEVDDYAENQINNALVIIKMFKNSKLVEERQIKNTFDMLNYEIIFQKN